MNIVDRGHATERLGQAIAGLKGLTAEALQYDSELLEQCLGLTLWLQSTLDRINGIRIEEPAGDIERRILTTEVGFRIASIAGELEKEQKLLQETLDIHEQQLADLKWNGHKTEDFEKLAPFPAERVNALKLNIVDLLAEQEKLQAFFANPDDVSILIGTSFEQMQE